GSVFIFCNRSRDKLKILYWECNGFWLYYRRLGKGKFKWPAELNEQMYHYPCVNYTGYWMVYHTCKQRHIPLFLA
ncbi:IS66 family insertion sequence element accessory protein TnpB, partial [Bathymodiolus platifrons methanotrophic gill symbiont]